MTTKWNFTETTEDDNTLIEHLSTSMQLDSTICKLLIQRGIKTEEDAEKFFTPKLSDLHDPFLMPDMDKAVKRLNKALGRKEKILIYGDYDVDGTTAVTLVYKFLQTYTSHIDFYIPDRYDEGYGVSHKGIDYAAQSGITLIITLDCGIKAVEKVEYAKTKGIDFIICDHHMPDEKLPDAVAVLDAKREDSIYPYEHLSGCGVGFKFMQAFAISNNFASNTLYSLLDLVAISIASDIVPITGENRILAHHGLKQINNNPSIGVKAIIDICKLKTKEITISDIIFKIGPRINASGRMMNGREAVELMTAKDLNIAKEKSKSIDKYNDERREMDQKTTTEAKQLIESTNIAMKDNKAIIVFNPQWHKGVIGIVASRLTERYNRPSIVLTKSSEYITGSARSVQGYDIYKAIEDCRDLLENFGGHTYAAGLTLKEENLETFKKRFLELASKQIEPEQMTPQIDIDCTISLNKVNNNLLAQLKRMAPFGPDNTNPVFCTHNTFDIGSSKRVGKDLDHLKLDVTDNTLSTAINGIAFGQGEKADAIKRSTPFKICYTIEENTYKGASSIQLMVKDIKTDE